MKKLFKEKAIVVEGQGDLERIERAIVSVRVGKARSTEQQMFRLITKYSATLRHHGYPDFPDKKPDIAMLHIIRKLPPGSLRDRVRMQVHWKKEEFKKSFNSFIQMVVSEAQQVDVQLSSERIESFKREEGFYQNTVKDSISDPKGYMWIATPNVLVKKLIKL